MNDPGALDRGFVLGNLVEKPVSDAENDDMKVAAEPLLDAPRLPAAEIVDAVRREAFILEAVERRGWDRESAGRCFDNRESRRADDGRLFSRSILDDVAASRYDVGYTIRAYQTVIAAGAAEEPRRLTEPSSPTLVEREALIEFMRDSVGLLDAEGFHVRAAEYASWATLVEHSVLLDDEDRALLDRVGNALWNISRGDAQWPVETTAETVRALSTEFDEWKRSILSRARRTEVSE